MIVVDSNIIAYFYLPGVYSTAGEQLFERDPDWNAPILWRSEFRNILTGYLRKGLLMFDQALAIQFEAQLLLERAEHQPDSKLVLELAQASTCSAYDCEFVALAQTLGTQLVTMDTKLIKAFPKTATPLVSTKRN